MKGTGTIESRAAQTILQKSVRVTVGGRTYEAAPPSTATLILASEAISRIPGAVMDEGKVVESSLAIARDCTPVAEVAAILILGAKEIRRSDRSLRGRLFRRRNAKYRLTQELLLEHSPSELFQLISKLLSTMQLGDFFAITTFLQGVNLLRPREVVEATTTTASGQ